MPAPVIKAAQPGRFASPAERLEFALYVLGATMLALAIVAGSPARLAYDESYFYPGIDLLRRLGLNGDFLRALDQSPGPLYQLFHLAWGGVTHLEIRSMRLLNLACIAGCVPLLAGCASLSGVGGRRAWLIAGSVIAIPPMWVISGLALTEAPAMLCLSASILLLLRTVQRPFDVVTGLMASLSGLLLSLAIIGRTPYLMVIPAAWVFALDRRFTARRSLAVFTALALMLPAPVFLAWGGVTPPLVSSIQSGVNPLFGLYGFAYACVFVALLAPGWIRWIPWAAAAAVCLTFAGGLANNISPVLTWLPMMTVAERLLPAPVALRLGYTFPALLAGFGLYFLFVMLVRTWEARRDSMRLFLILGAMAIILTCAKSSAQFSSRYVVQAAPFLILMTAESTAAGTGRVLRLLLGAGLGIASLLSYYR